MSEHGHSHSDAFAQKEGRWAQAAEERISLFRHDEEIERALAFGLAGSPTLVDRTIPTFSRGELPHFAGERGTFLNAPFLEDVNQVEDAEVAVFGAPLDSGATYRPGARFGPQGIRRSTNLFGTYCYELGVDLREQLNMVDIGDVFTIPGNLEKSFDQISQAMAHVYQRGVFPVILGGDHSIGYPTIRGMAPYVDGNIGIIHFDRHVDTQETDLDERMHTTPWFHATNLKNAPATNLVQIGIGGWQSPRAGVKVGRERGTTIMTVGDVERVGHREDRRDRPRDRLEGRQGGLPVLRHRRDRRRLRAGHRLAGARRAVAPRSPQPDPDDLRARPCRLGGRRVRPALRLGRADGAVELPGDLGLARRVGPGGAPGEEGRCPGSARLGSASLRVNHRRNSRPGVY